MEEKDERSLLGGAYPINGIDALNEEQTRLKMSTGAPDLDSLIGGIEQGTSYLFYGDQAITTTLVHQIMVKGVARETDGGFDSQVIYINNTDYYTARTVLSPTLLGELAKKMRIDPKHVFERVYVAAAYNEERQKLAAERVCALLRARIDESQGNAIKLVVFHNATCFIPGSSDPKKLSSI